ncbi:hypothetical protein P3L10_018958 [Capsicum annuum]
MPCAAARADVARLKQVPLDTIARPWGSRGDEGTPRLVHGRRPRRPPALAADWARPHACSAWSLPREQHPGLAARTKAPPRPKSSASSPVADDATDSLHERTMKRGRRCCTGTDGSHGLAMHAAMRPRCTPTWPLSAYAS